MSSQQTPSVRSTELLSTHMPGAFPDTQSVSTPSIAAQHNSLSHALYERRAEYTRPRSVRIKVGTWNTAAQKGTEKDIGAWFVGGKGVEEVLSGLSIYEGRGSTESDTEAVRAQEARHAKHVQTIPHHDPGSVPGNTEVGLYVLGLQEIVDITSPTEALRPYTDPTVAKKWKDSLEKALPAGYQLVAEQQLIGLWLVIYASPEIFPQVKNVSTTSVGTGLMGYMGNKGAVTTRIVLGETTRLVFINAHMAAGNDKASLDRRNWDAGQIASRTRFDPIVDALGPSQNQGEGLGDEEFAFWFGDLNYRLSLPGDDVRSLLTIHTKNLEPDNSSTNDATSQLVQSSYRSNSGSEEDEIPLPPELDPASLQTTISSLLPHDELHQQMENGKAFHDGWQEGPIRFLPSYKYDIGKVGVFDSSEKRRCPSWCDRILYRTRAAKLKYDMLVKEGEQARKRDEEMKATGMGGTSDDDILFDYDPDKDGDNTTSYEDYDEDQDQDQDQDQGSQPIVTKDGLSDEILLEYYVSHQRVLSSDHKPLDAIFSLKYDAVIPDLKAGVHAEIVRELDRQENEGRPSIAVVVERAPGSSLDEESKTTDSAFEGVDFGDVKFAKSKSRTITIANTGRVPATFGFADRPGGHGQAAGPFPDWLGVTFDREPDKNNKHGPDDVQERYTIEPADVINVELKFKIEDTSAVRNLNEGSLSLEEILVLRVEDGRDHFLPVRAHWLQSALARTIDKLIKIPEGGIRKLQNQIPARDEVIWSVPREIFRLTALIEDLIERALAEWEMRDDGAKRAPWQDNACWPFTRIPGELGRLPPSNHDELASLFDALDCDTLLSNAFFPESGITARVELAAEALVVFLSSLCDGVITKSLWEKLEEAMVMREKIKQTPSADDEKMAILETMASAPHHNATFLLLVSFLQNIAGQITESAKAKAVTPRTSIDLPASPKVNVRRRTLSKVPEVALRQLIVRNYAVVFSDAMFRTKDEAKVREKGRSLAKERMVRMLQLFLDNGVE